MTSHGTAPATGEFDLIARLAATLGRAGAPVRLGIGDDAALLEPDLVWSLDLLVEDVHFRRATTSGEDLGWKALAVNLSDLAAMAAAPVAALVGLVVPAAWTSDDLVGIYAGLRAAGEAHGCPVVGGDVSRGPALVLAVTVLGRTATPLRRDGARPGDLLAVTGMLGGSEAGRLVLEGRVSAPATADALAARHRRPQPRLAAGALLAGVATAALDVSDGVASDARRLAEASGVTIAVDLDALPLQEGVAAVAAALGVPAAVFAAGGGEDYELLVTLPPAATVPVPLTVIGAVEAGPPTVRFSGRDADVPPRGYDHLAGSR